MSSSQDLHGDDQADQKDREKGHSDRADGVASLRLFIVPIGFRRDDVLVF